MFHYNMAFDQNDSVTSSSRGNTSWYFNFGEPIEDKLKTSNTQLETFLKDSSKKSTLEFDEIARDPLFTKQTNLSRCLCWCCCCSCDCPRNRARVGSMEQHSRYNPKPSKEEVNDWSISFEKLLVSKTGIKIFHDFLKSQYSDENLLFWLAVEQLKNGEREPTELKKMAQDIYTDYLSSESPKEVSLDHKTRQMIEDEMEEPCHTTFNNAQKQVYYVMYQDCYPRFLVSDTFKVLLMD